MADLMKPQPAGLPAVAGPRPENIWIDQYLDDKQGEIGRLLQVLAKRKWLVIGVAAAVVIGVGI